MKPPPPLGLDASTFEKVPGARILVSALNRWTDIVRIALTRSLTFAENIDAEVLEFPFRGGSTDVAIATRYKRPPLGVIVLGAWSTEAPSTPITASVFAHWTFQADRGIVLSNVTGLASGTDYTLRLLAIGA